MARAQPVSTPSGWQVESSAGFGPFVSRILYRLPDGSRRLWDSRADRKLGDRPVVGSVPVRTRWIAGLFAIGSACFALGSFPAYFHAVDYRTDSITFFIGSIFFTTAAYLVVAEVSGTPDTPTADPRRVRLFSFRPRRIDWWAAQIQFVGTVAFNVTTFTAIYQGWSADKAKVLVWAPDVVGSICFLVSSYLSWAEVCHSAGRLRFRDVSWWIVVLNLLGSIWFGLSAVGAKVLPDGEVRNLSLVNLGTFGGAVCFFAGALLLVPEARRQLPAP